jgi:HAD superfamily hydrolase (TIGR01509 family)
MPARPSGAPPEIAMDAAVSALKALVFDFDGTIADTEETHRQAFNYAFVRFGLPWEWTRSMYRDLLKVSGGKERLVHFIDALYATDSKKERLRRLVPALHQAKTELYTELVADGRCPFRPGVSRMFAEATAAGVQLAIATTSSAASVNALLAQHLGRGSRCRFVAIVCGEHVRAKKPAPDLYTLALAMLGRRARECAAIEDSINGVRAAKQAGLFTVVTPSPWTEGDDFDGADLVLPHLGDPEDPLPPEKADEIGCAWLPLRELARRHAESVAMGAGA